MVVPETQLVELVDPDGAATGACTVAEAHTAPGRPVTLLAYYR